MELDRERLIENLLPKDMRLKLVLADLEGPAHIVINIPDLHLLQKVSGKRFLGLLKKWETIGHIKEYWPADRESIIHINPGDNAETHRGDIQQALEQAGVADRFHVVIDEPISFK